MRRETCAPLLVDFESDITRPYSVDFGPNGELLSVKPVTRRPSKPTLEIAPEIRQLGVRAETLAEDIARIGGEVRVRDGNLETSVPADREEAVQRLFSIWYGGGQ